MLEVLYLGVNLILIIPNVGFSSLYTLTHVLTQGPEGRQ